MEYLKNPILIAIVASALTFAYMWYDNKKKKEQNPKMKDESINLLPVGVVGVIVWFISSTMLDKNKKSVTKTIEAPVRTNNIVLPNNDVFIDLAKFD